MFFRTALALLLSLTATVSATSTKPRRNLRVGLNTTGTIGTTSFFQLLRKVALKGGDEFDSPDTYQSRALEYVDDTLGLSLNDDDFVVYYALACLFYSTNAVHNKHTVSAFGLDFALAGWTNADGWLSVSTTAVNDQGVTVDVPVNKCNWHGITCDDQNRVVSIELFSNNLTGNFPPEIQHLGSTLQVIDIYDNQFLATEGDDGNDWMGKMPALRNLFFRSTSFEYHGIPTFWAGSSNLEQIDLSNTFFTNGPIRENAFRDLPNLWYLDIGANVYTGDFLPKSLLNLPSLTNFYMQDASWTDVDVNLSFVSELKSIGQLFVDNTVIGGEIPAMLGDATTLFSLAMSECQLTGSIPTELAKLTDLESLYLFENQLTGNIPTLLGTLQNLTFFYTQGNDLVGTMPSEVCFRRDPVGLLLELGTDCAPGAVEVQCTCCTCCGVSACAGDSRRHLSTKTRRESHAAVTESS